MKNKIFQSEIEIIKSLDLDERYYYLFLRIYGYIVVNNYTKDYEALDKLFDRGLISKERNLFGARYKLTDDILGVIA